MEEERNFISRVEKIEERVRELSGEEGEEEALLSLEAAVEEIESVGKEMEEGIRGGDTAEENER